MGVKLHEESKYFIRILLLVSTRPYFAARLYAKSVKPACVHTNPNYHQGTPGPPECAGIIDLMMFSPAEKRVAFIQKSRKIMKNRNKRDFSAIFHFFAIFE